MEKRKPTGRRRTRVEPPTLDEAIAAAQGITFDPAQQVQLAAELMGVPETEVHPLIERAAKPARPIIKQPSHSRPVFVVERKTRRTVARRG